MRQRSIALERHPFFRQLPLTAGNPKRLVAAMHWVAVMKRLLSPCKPRSQSAVGQQQSLAEPGSGPAKDAKPSDRIPDTSRSVQHFIADSHDG